MYLLSVFTSANVIIILVLSLIVPSFSGRLPISSHDDHAKPTVRQLKNIAVFRKLGKTLGNTAYLHLAFDIPIYDLARNLTSLCVKANNTLPSISDLRTLNRTIPQELAEDLSTSFEAEL